jgi:cytochrome c oxidase assembly protein subunit 11
MRPPRDPNRRVVAILASVVVTMGALAWAAVPFYTWFCQVTGYYGTTSRAEKAPDQILDRTIDIRFDGNTDAAMPWQFKPVVHKMTLRIGETGLAFYEAYNPTDRTIAGTAIFNVAPDSAGGYFTKIDCFCFTLQVLKPHERVEMPVSFFVDPAILDDADAKHLKSITLSYTFYETEIPQDAATLELPAETGQEPTN